MKIIRNKFIPFPGFKAINLFGVLFVRKNAYIGEGILNHEAIHTAQMKELFYVFFYLWYGVEWVVRYIKYLDTHEAYRNISFEREAYNNSYDLEYLETRPKFNFIKYI